MVLSLQVFCLLTSMFENTIAWLEINLAALMRSQRNDFLLCGKEKQLSVIARYGMVSNIWWSFQQHPHVCTASVGFIPPCTFVQRFLVVVPVWPARVSYISPCPALRLYKAVRPNCAQFLLNHLVLRQR